MCALALFKIHLSPEKQNNCWGKKKKIKQPVLYHRCKRLSCYVNILEKKGIYRLNVTPNRMVKFSLLIHTP